jgi:hypothetical protein
VRKTTTGAHSILLRITAALCLFGSQLEVQPELLFEIPVGSVPTQRSRQAG